MNPEQGDEFTDTLADGKLLRCDKLECLRLVQCGMTCNGAVRLAKALEGVGECKGEKTRGTVCMGQEDKGVVQGGSAGGRRE